ncbi:hypothetical protein X801_03623, partial [Opisthorchis viverrini]
MGEDGPSQEDLVIRLKGHRVFVAVRVNKLTTVASGIMKSWVSNRAIGIDAVHLEAMIVSVLFAVGILEFLHSRSNLLNPGDKVCLVEGNLFCELEFPQLFSTTTVKWSPTMKPPNQAISNLLMTSTNQTDLLRNLVQHQQQQDLNTKPALFVRSPSYPNPPDGQNIGSIRYSPVPMNHSDFPGTLSSHPESPVMTMINPNHMFPDNPLTPNSGLGLSDIDPSFSTESVSIVQTLATDKQANKGNTAAGGQGNESTAPSGRKKQK